MDKRGTAPSPDIAVVIGVGEMGLAIARRIAPGRRIFLADRDADLLERRRQELAANGHDTDSFEVDVTSAESVNGLARAAAESGRVVAMVHTAGVSPLRASIEAILAVDLLGTALVLDAFASVIAPGGSGLAIASMAAQFFPSPDHEVERELAITPCEDLLDLQATRPEAFANPAEAYALSKQANIARVAEQSKVWGARGATLNAISPGVIATAMGREELAGENGLAMRELIELSGTGRVGTPDDIASVAAFLLSPAASFVTGTNLVVDGGVHAAVRF